MSYAQCIEWCLKYLKTLTIKIKNKRKKIYDCTKIKLKKYKKEEIVEIEVKEQFESSSILISFRFLKLLFNQVIYLFFYLFIKS